MKKTDVARNNNITTDLMNINQIDAFINAHLEPKNEEIPIEIRKTTTSSDVQRVHQLLKHLRSKKLCQNIVKIMQTTESDVAKQSIINFYYEAMTKPTIAMEQIEKSQVSLSSMSLESLASSSIMSDTLSTYCDILKTIPDVFEVLDEDTKYPFLEVLSRTLTTIIPNTSNDNPLPFQVYSEVTAACTKIMLQKENKKDLLISFAKLVLAQLINVAVTVSEVSKSSKTQLTSYAAYIGELLPFVAAMENCYTDSDVELAKLLQQFWILCVIFAASNINLFFSQWEGSLTTIARFMPPLLHRATRGDFAAVKFRVQELLNIIKPPTMTKTTEILPLFSKRIPQLNLKLVQNLELADAVYLLSLFALERLRANRAIIGPLFHYFEAEYTSTFSSVLDSMVEPLFSRFTSALEQFEDPDEGRRGANGMMRVLIERYAWPVPRIQSIVDTYFRSFADSHPTVLFDIDVLRALTSCELQLRTTTPERQQVFYSVIASLFRHSTSVAPFAFAAVLEHLVVDSCPSNFMSMRPSFVNPILGYLPTSARDRFISELTKKAVLHGMAIYVDLDRVKAVPDIEDRALLAAAYAAMHSDSNAVPILLERGPGDSLKAAWSHVIMNGGRSLSSKMSRALIEYLLYSVNTQRGIWASTLDLEEVRMQAAVLQLFIEQSALGHDMSEVLVAIHAASSAPLLKDSASIMAILPLAQLTCFILQSPLHISLRCVDELQTFVVRLSLKAFSYIDDHTVLQYATTIEIASLRTLIQLISSAIGKVPSEKIQEASMKSSGGTYGPEKVSRAVSLAAARSSTNYASTRPFDQKASSRVCALIAYMLCNLLSLFLSYIDMTDAASQRLLALHMMKPKAMHLGTALPFMYFLCPEAIPPLVHLVPDKGAIGTVLHKLVTTELFTAASVPELSLVLARMPNFERDSLAVWAPVSPISALCLLNADIMKDPRAASYVSRCLDRFDDDSARLFIPQLIQSLRFDSSGSMRNFLTHFARRSTPFTHYLLWNILAEKNNVVSQGDPLPGILNELERQLIEEMTPEQHSLYEGEFKLIDTLDVVSQRLLPLEIPDRPPALTDALRSMELPDGLYVPSNPHYKIVSIDAEQSVPLKSHARVPILVRFEVYDDRDEEKKHMPFSCIFKIHDDVRQDAMMIQFIDTFRRIFDDAGLDTFLYPYRVFATGENRGVIEVIPNAKSRHDLGTATNEELPKYFVNKYGQVGSPAFERAQHNFIRSMAPNSLLCYLFQVKDRHNANIMLDEDGHVIHIDFGFIFEISPGGGLKFERAPFKLTKEMIDVMGGSLDAAPFREFRSLLTKCFLAARSRHAEIEAIADLMRSAGFPCFRADSIKKLRERFFVHLSPKDVSVAVDGLIQESAEALTTTGYDAFQAKSNGIYF